MVVTREQLVDLIAADRAAGRSIAFANGCFDLLHVGHVRYLQAAAAEGDRLVVAVNDDGVAALKGPGRPIMSGRRSRGARGGAARRRLRRHLCRSQRSRRLLNLLQPDVHCKGTDYTLETVPERETVRAYGGRIAIVGDPKDHSTRDLLARIRGNGR